MADDTYNPFPAGIPDDWWTRQRTDEEQAALERVREASRAHRPASLPPGGAFDLQRGPFDIRERPVDGRLVWRDGRCLECGAPTHGSDATHAPPEAMTPVEERRTCDYYVWCTDRHCPNYAGECVGDMECPPEWATHEKDPSP